MSVLLDEALKLPNAERRRLADDIYGSLEGSTDEITLSAEQLDELESRIAEYQANPKSGLAWDLVRDAALKR